MTPHSWKFIVALFLLILGLLQPAYLLARPDTIPASLNYHPGNFPEPSKSETLGLLSAGRSVPEPGTLYLLGSGLIAVGLARYFIRSKWKRS
jgi:hypothetical protein